MEVTRLLVKSYFDIVRKNLQDAVPKAVMHFLVNHTQRGLQQHLIRALYREELFAEMMTEREDIAAKRLACHNAVTALREALAALDALPSNLVASVNPVGSRSMQGNSAFSSALPALPENRTISSAPSSPMRGYGSRGNNPRAARMAVAAMAASALKEDADLTRRAESVANPFCWDK